MDGRARRSGPIHGSSREQPNPNPSPDLDSAAYDERFARDLIDQGTTLRRFAAAMTRSPADTDDLVQDVLERAWRNRRTFRSESALTTWLYRITINLPAMWPHARRLSAQNHRARATSMYRSATSSTPRRWRRRSAIDPRCERRWRR
ncbi:RNA polymerase sigma factor [Antrihabitans spumae]|uniref:RNA polymerase sigma factor n=1 Tax=Antrihabitans spumae TaxID=3373370 RepID=A0ABW7KKW7_9NOCA